MVLFVKQVAIAASQGHGQGYHNCSCKGDCLTKRCKCQKCRLLCNSHCHPRNEQCKIHWWHTVKHTLDNDLANACTHTHTHAHTHTDWNSFLEWNGILLALLHTVLTFVLRYYLNKFNMTTSLHLLVFVNPMCLWHWQILDTSCLLVLVLPVLRTDCFDHYR